MDAVQFISGTDALKATSTDIRVVHFPDTFPDGTPVTLIRRASVTCSNTMHVSLPQHFRRHEFSLAFRRALVARSLAWEGSRAALN